MYLSQGLSSPICCFPLALTASVLVCSGSLMSTECFGDSDFSSDSSELSSLSSSSGSKLQVNVMHIKGDQEPFKMITIISMDHL